MVNIEKVYEDYSDIIEQFGLDKIKDRYRNLSTAYNTFIREMNWENEVHLNGLILMHAIMDYFTDVSRLKKFHEIELINLYKIKAYEISWLLRRKPLQVYSEEETLVFANEKFLLSYAIDFLFEGAGDDWYDSIPSKVKDELGGYIDSLFYYFEFRECDPKSLELAFLSFEAGKIMKLNQVEKQSVQYKKEVVSIENILSAVKEDKELSIPLIISPETAVTKEVGEEIVAKKVYEEVAASMEI